ncbi:recombinase family protein [Streptomyces eurythermus]
MVRAWRAGPICVPSLDRLGRSIQDFIAIVSGLRKRGVGFTSLHEALDMTTAEAWSSTCSRHGGVHSRAHRVGHQRGLFSCHFAVRRARGIF